MNNILRHTLAMQAAKRAVSVRAPVRPMGKVEKITRPLPQRR
jgi:hypothetical protein